MREVVPKRMNQFRWNLTSKCNYRCSYCMTSHIRNHYQKQYSSIFRFVNRFSQILSGKWEVSLDGLGEPFCASDFVEVVRKLSDYGFYISVSTNFSFPHVEIDRFIQAAGDNLLKIGASLHLEHVDPAVFLDKVIYYNKIIPGKIFVKYVVTKEGLLLLDKIKNVLDENNIKLLLIAERVVKKRSLATRKYSRKELNKIRLCKVRLWEDRSLSGKLCWAGCRHFVVGEDGNAYRCAPARTYNSKGTFLGNIFDESFRLFSKPTPCTTPNCYCSYSWLFT